ncbi:ClpP/crotonase [Gymnopus androsaceus JB14]|uniref:ClpP/crotonase n=1 Tax=Gymnopus androsaceus JB14 TaxID=1447944 RepID=A0A6A4GPQ6_9AGAR|nr:ClpP/crotonase [Gymnopus androsaceus JB14]
MKDLSSKWIKISEPFPHVLLVELSRFWQAYGALFNSISEETSDVRAVVLSSAFPDIFTAGLDLLEAGDVAKTTANADSVDPARVALDFPKISKPFQEAITAPERCLFPVIAAIYGIVVGLSVDIVAACDIRYAASNARFTIKEIDIGQGERGNFAKILLQDRSCHTTTTTTHTDLWDPAIGRPLVFTGTHRYSEVDEYISWVLAAHTNVFLSCSHTNHYVHKLAADMGTLAYLPKITGNMSLVCEMAYTAQFFPASKVEQMGLVSKVVDGGRNEVVAAALDLAKLIAMKSPVAVDSVAENLEYTSTWNSAMLQTKDMMESLLAKKTKQPANFLPLNYKFGPKSKL